MNLALGVGLAMASIPRADASPWAQHWFLRFGFAQEIASQRQHASGNLPAREIERRVQATMGNAQYLGFVYDPETNIYTLKFLRNGSVIWVDVDGRSGRIVRRSGN